MASGHEDFQTAAVMRGVYAGEQITLAVDSSGRLRVLRINVSDLAGVHGDLAGLDANDHPQYALAGSIDHGALLGLTDDDHPLYLPVDGSRPFTGLALYRDVLNNYLDLRGGTTAGGAGGRIILAGKEATPEGGFVSVGVPNAAGDEFITLALFRGNTDTPYLDMYSHQIKGLAEPTADSDAATKYYHDTDTSLIKCDGSRNFSGNQSMGNKRLVDVADPVNAQDADTLAARNAALAGATVSGAFVTKTIYYGGPQDHTMNAKTHTIVAIVVGAGGGGGGASRASGNNPAAGGGGGGGGVAIAVMPVTPSGTYHLTIGMEGTGGTPGNDGTAGGNSTLTIGGTVITGGGGGGGTGCYLAGTATCQLYSGGAGGTASGGYIAHTGQRGGFGYCAGVYGVGGYGGAPGSLGRPTLGYYGTYNGEAGELGSGGEGGKSWNGNPATGGKGGRGYMEIWEYT